ncbi:DUF4105 domain-containing protein [Legionella sp. W05-934-2]|uniref:Lnb N-terminal periplasmic domain-containing protein n=1 Tax=Legionella sp. W05-934-2 TaxID=1198649 RepID=UPI0034629D42
MKTVSNKKKLPWYGKPFYWLYQIGLFLVKLGFILWAAGALYYIKLDLPLSYVNGVLSISFTLFGIWVFWLEKTKRWVRGYYLLYIGLLISWWSLMTPSHDRPWLKEVAVMPKAYINGDTVRITGVRNFDYRSRDDFTVKYEERTVQLSHLVGLDLYISYFMPGPVGHTFVSFIFDNAPPLSVSIETRPEIGESFAPIASMFRQFELIYVVGDERDIVRVRTNFRNEQVYLYRIRMSKQKLRELFLVYLRRINELADNPEFYHLLSNSCTINIIRYANKAGRVGRIDFRHYLNGLIDSYFYSQGQLKPTDIPFVELRQQSNINKKAQQANDSTDFSQKIRSGLPE